MRKCFSVLLLYYPWKVMLGTDYKTFVFWDEYVPKMSNAECRHYYLQASMLFKPFWLTILFTAENSSLHQCPRVHKQMTPHFTLQDVNLLSTFLHKYDLQYHPIWTNKPKYYTWPCIFRSNVCKIIENTKVFSNLQALLNISKTVKA